MGPFLPCPFLFLFHLTVTPTWHGRESQGFVNVTSDLHLAKWQAAVFLLDLCAAFGTARDDPLLQETPFFSWFPGCQSSGFSLVSHNGPFFPLMVLPLPPGFLTLESPRGHSLNTLSSLKNLSSLGTLVHLQSFTDHLYKTHLLSPAFASLSSQLPTQCPHLEV